MKLIVQRQLSFASLKFILLAGLIVCSAAGCSLFGTSRTVLPAMPPPEGAFPAQIGYLKIKGEPKQSEYSTAERRTYDGYYVSPQNTQVEYDLEIFSKPDDKPSSLPYGWELLNESGATRVAFAVGLERVYILVQGGEGVSCKAMAESVADANEILKNFPYQALKAAPPVQPVVVSLPPSFQPKPPEKQPAKATKADKDFDKAVRDTTLSLVELWFTTKGVKSKPRVNKLDESTLMTGADEKAEKVSNLARSFKNDMGQALKDAGFRQFVVYPDVVKLD